MRKLTITFELTKWIQSDMGKIGLLIELTNVLTMLIYTIDHFWPFESNYRKIICIVRIRGRNTIWKIGSRSKRSNYRKIELKGVELSAVDCIHLLQNIAPNVLYPYYKIPQLLIGLIVAASSKFSVASAI